MSDKLGWGEFLNGRDVSVGKEIVEAMVSEEIGLPVRYRDVTTKKTDVVVDLNSSDNKASAREKFEHPTQLIGVVLPLPNDEYLFVGIYEAGGVLAIKDKDINGYLTDRLDPEKESVCFIQHKKFWGYIGGLRGVEKRTSEDNDPTTYMQMVVSAVEQARSEKAKLKASRAETRENLLKLIFPDDSPQG